MIIIKKKQSLNSNTFILIQIRLLIHILNLPFMIPYYYSFQNYSQAYFLCLPYKYLFINIKRFF